MDAYTRLLVILFALITGELLLFIGLFSHFVLPGFGLWLFLVIMALVVPVFLTTFLGKPFSIHHFFFIAFLRLILRRPMLLSQLRIKPLQWVLPYQSQLDDLSLEGQKDFGDMVASLRNLCVGYRPESLDATDRRSWDVMRWYLDTLHEGFSLKVYAYPVFHFSIYPINQLEGVQSAIPAFLINTHQVNSVRDAHDYIKRVSAFKQAMAQVSEDLKMRARDYTLPPRFVLESVLKEISSAWCSPQEATQTALYKKLEDSLQQLRKKGLVSESQQKRLMDTLEERISSVVIKAYDQLATVLREMIPKASKDDGLWRLDNGEKMYSYFLRFFTTTNMTAKEIHDLGLKEMSRIHGEVKQIFREEGLDPADLPGSFKALRERDDFLEEESDTGRDALLKKYEKIIQDANAEMDKLFDLKPDIGVTVERVPRFKEKGSPLAYYFPPPLDRSKGGVFYCNLQSVRAHPSWAMQTLAYHEAIPGHHYQLTVAQKLGALPIFRRNLPFMAYTEGWGLYAEHLAFESGLLRTRLDKLGFYQAELWRAVRLIVDTGIHAFRWTREEAIEFMINNAGMAPDEARIEIERYIVWPGQACAYKIGQLKILELRELAQSRLGSKFALKGFHNTILSCGALPLEHLEKVVEDWIAGQS